jgi:hypothetical protein
LRLQRSVAVPHSGTAPDDTNFNNIHFTRIQKLTICDEGLWCIDRRQTCPSPGPHSARKGAEPRGRCVSWGTGFTPAWLSTPRQFEAEHFKKGSNFFEENVTATSSQKRNEVQESKRNKWKGPTRSVGSSPFMPDYDLERSKVF